MFLTPKSYVLVGSGRTLGSSEGDCHTGAAGPELGRQCHWLRSHQERGPHVLRTAYPEAGRSPNRGCGGPEIRGQAVRSAAGSSPERRALGKSPPPWGSNKLTKAAETENGTECLGITQTWSGQSKKNPRKACTKITQMTPCLQRQGEAPHRAGRGSWSLRI